MQTFKQFVAESGDSAYPFKHDGVTDMERSKFSHKHNYVFAAHNSEPYTVSIMHHTSPFEQHHATVEFRGYHSAYGKSDSQGSGAVKVFSTVRNILAKHAKENPQLKQFNFSSNKRDLSRASLYSRMAKRLGGGTDDNESGREYDHWIPTSSLHESNVNLNIR